MFFTKKNIPREFFAEQVHIRCDERRAESNSESRTASADRDSSLSPAATGRSEGGKRRGGERRGGERRGDERRGEERLPRGNHLPKSC